MKDIFLNIKSFNDLAVFLGTDVKRLGYELYGRPEALKYKSFRVKKKNNGHRTIQTPNEKLKHFQTIISNVLYDIYKPRKGARGFLKGVSIVDNARTHLEQNYVLNIDLSDFFGTINFGRVRGLFMSSPFNFESNVATYIAQICCYEGKLPQGAPSSPIISNMICSKLDKIFYTSAKRLQIRYTRYADDITFSFSSQSVPDFVGTLNKESQFTLSDKIISIVERNGFTVNHDKVRLQHKEMAQIVTGLKVNEIVNVNRNYVRQLKSILYCWKQHGYDATSREYFNNHYSKQRNSNYGLPSLENVLLGKLLFLRQVKGNKDPIFVNLVKYARNVDPDKFRIKLTYLDHLYYTFLDLEKGILNGKQITPINRGLELEKLLNGLFKYFKINVLESFRRNENVEQIDGAFKFENWNYLVECKWKAKLSDHAETSSLYAKIGRSGGQTMGLFISINGWTDSVPGILKQNPVKNIFLMEKEDLLSILSGKVNLTTVLNYKLEALNFKSEPYVPIKHLESSR